MSYGSRRWSMAVACAAVVLALGCGGDAPDPAAGGDENAVSVGDTQAPAVGQRVIRGLCVVGHEVRTFIPCGSNKVYWMQTDPAGLAAFQVAIDRFTDEPFEPFFAEIEGRLTDEVGDGFAADYDGQFFVERLIRLAPAGELDCDE